MNNAQETARQISERLNKRHRAERRFRFYGIVAIAIGLASVATLFVNIFGKGYTAFVKSEIRLDLDLDPVLLEIRDPDDPEQLQRAYYEAAIYEALYQRFPEVTARAERTDLRGLISSGAAFDLRDRVIADPDLLGTRLTLWLTADDEVDSFRKGFISRDVDESERRVKDHEIAWIDALEASGDLRTAFNSTFFTSGDSREPEQAGIWGAVVGSFLTLIVTLLLSFQIGVAAAIYLEEFAPKNRFTEIIEVNINNLAAVPSIIFGLLGLAIFINFFGLPRSAPLVGGLVLTLMTLPTVIISSRATIKAVPPSIREAALGMGASRNQTVFHHVLPLAMPGMLTGAIIGMARALGETAPLLMIGMVAFIVDVPGSITDASTVLPVQVYLWADSPERAFVEKTSGAVIVLLSFLILMNAAAVLLRKRLERRW